MKENCVRGINNYFYLTNYADYYSITNEHYSIHLQHMPEFNTYLDVFMHQLKNFKILLRTYSTKNEATDM